MTRAVVVVFYRHDPIFGDMNLMLPQFFYKHMETWLKYVDAVYIMDNGIGLAEYDNPKVHVVNRDIRSHWAALNEGTEMAKEDAILYLDPDTVIYDPELVDRIFKKIESGFDYVGCLDTSGSEDLFPENENRGVRRRFTPYLGCLKRSMLPENFDFTPTQGEKWKDSMGTVTDHFVNNNAKIEEIQDDRSTISLEDDGRITHVQWLDSPPKKWSMVEDPNIGFYHMRNFGGSLTIVTSFLTNILDYEKLAAITPGRELRRLIAWPVVIGEKVGFNFDLPELGEGWENYLKEFKKYHSWLGKV
jgi:glycosyltransferase involved in cell wall biosynthesis